MKQTPVGPLLATVLVVLAGTLYLTRSRTTSDTSRRFLDDAPSINTLRILSWTMTATDSNAAKTSLLQVTRALVLYAPHVITLQNAPNNEFTANLARQLGEGWDVVSVSRLMQDDQQLAIFLHPALTLQQRAIIETGTPEEALVVTFAPANGQKFHIISLWAPMEEVHRRRQYHRRILDWCDQHGGAITVLAGGFNLLKPINDNSGRNVPQSDLHMYEEYKNRFAEITQSNGRRNPNGDDGVYRLQGLFINSPIASLKNKAVLTDEPFQHDDAPPFIVDLKLP